MLGQAETTDNQASAVESDIDSRLLASLLRFVVGAVLFYALVSLVVNPATWPRTVTVAVVTLVPASGLMKLLSRGQTRRAAGLMVSGLWLLETMLAVTAFGVQGQSYNLGYAATVLAAGVLLGTRAAVLAAGASLLAGLVMVVGETQGWLQPVRTDVPWQVLAGSAFYLPAIVMMQHLAAQRLRNALDEVSRIAEQRRQALDRVAAAEAEQASSEALLAAAFEQLPAGILVVDSAGEARLLNERARGMLDGSGAWHDGLAAGGIWRAYRPDGSAYAPDQLPHARAVRDNVSVAAEELMLDVGGRRAWYSVNAGPLHGPDQTLTGGIAIFDDITARKELEQARLLSDERLASVMDTVPQALLFTELETGRILRVNDAALELFRWDRRKAERETSLGMGLYHCLEDRQRMVAEVRRAGRLNGYEIRLRRGDGTPVDILIWSNTLHASDPPAAIWACADITERNALEAAHRAQAEALRQSEERFRTLVNQSTTGIALVDSEGRIAAWNEAIERLTGLGRAEALGRFVWDVQAAVTPRLRGHPERLAQVERQTREALRTGESPLFEGSYQFTLRRADGESRVVRQSVFPIATAEGSRLGTFLTDVTALVEAEGALARREAQLEALFNGMDECVALHELVYDDAGQAVDYRIADVNLRYCEILAVQREQVLGRLATEVYDVAHAPYLDHYAMVAATGRRARLELPFGSPERVFDVSVAPWGEGGFATIFTDITERRQAVQALRESEALLRTVVSNLPVVLFAFDSQGRFTFSEGQGLQTLGLRPGEVVGASVYDVYRDHPSILEAIRGAYGGAVRHDLALLHGHHYDAWYVPIRGDAGDVEGVVGVAIDVTEKETAARAIRENEEALETIFEESPFVITLTTLDGVYLRVNRQVEEHSGTPREQLIGRRFTDFAELFDPQRSAELTGRLAAEGRVDNVEMRVRRADGSTADGIFSSRVLQLRGEPVVLSVWQDISDRTAVEEALRQTVERLEQINAEMERFAYTVSHDLKSPLITITGFVERLRHDLAAGRQDRADRSIDRILAAADRMTRLLDELLELSRIGRLRNPPETVAVAALVDEAAALVAGQLLAGGVTVTVDEALPRVHGDRRRLVEVFQNLMDNAAKFAAGETPEIVIAAAPPDAASGWPVVTVRDNGVGFEPQYAERIFGLFDQLDREQGGTGIGLALVKRIVETHGGWIRAESGGPGTGATFTFSLPPAEPT